jgi:hypothetical protein
MVFFHPSSFILHPFKESVMKPVLTHHYGTTIGPLNFPQSDRAASALDAVLRSLPKTPEYEYRKAVSAKAPTELNPGERSDVSWITTESVDRMGEVVLARGMDDSQFQGNPLVTLGHAYWLPPVGRSLWRKRTRDGSLVGVKAKTQYPPRPESWPAADPWPPDKVLALVQAGLLQGKSIGFLPTKVHVPDEKEVRQIGWGDQVSLVIDEWLLLEYACVFLPANQNALVEAVSKGSVDVPSDLLDALGLNALQAPARTIVFTPWEEVERAVTRRIDSIDFLTLTQQALQRGLDKARGRI